MAVEVKIGVHNATRELVIESTQTPEEVEGAIRAALTDGEGLIDLSDEHGRRILVRVEHLTYIELGEPVERRVGFGAV